MFDDIDLSQDAIEKFKQGARQYPKLEFTNVTDSSGNVVEGSSILDNSDKTLNELITEHVRLDGISVEFASITVNTFELGTMCAGSVNIELFRDGLDDYYFDRATVTVSIGVMLDDGSFEYCGFGVYNIDEVKKTKYSVKLTGLDNMMKFNKPCVSGKDLDGNPTFIIHIGDTIKDAISAICDYCDVEFKPDELESLTNKGRGIENIPSDMDKITCRQALSQLIALTGCSGRIDSDGYFRVTPYVYDDTIISEGDRYESEIDEKAVVLTGLRLINANGNAHLAGQEGYVLELAQNDFVVYDVRELAESIWEFLSEDARNVEYTPYLVTAVSLPHLRPLNKIWITNANGETHGTIITNYLFKLNNFTKIEAKGIGAVRKGYGKPNDFTRNQSRIITKTAQDVDTTRNVAVRSLAQFNETITASMGLYRTEKDGKWYFHDKVTLDDSKKVFTMVSDGIAWTDDYKGDDTVWQNGVEVTGKAFFRKLLAGGIIVGDESTNYNLTLTPEQFAINEKGAGTVTRINKGLMTIPRLEVGTHLDLGVLRVVPNSNGIDILYVN